RRRRGDGRWRRGRRRSGRPRERRRGWRRRCRGRGRRRGGEALVDLSSRRRERRLVGGAKAANVRLSRLREAVGVAALSLTERNERQVILGPELAALLTEVGDRRRSAGRGVPGVERSQHFLLRRPVVPAIKRLAAVLVVLPPG